MSLYANTPRTTGFDGLVELVATLRGEQGCPWDKAQTHQSIAANFIEESYEAVEAIEQGDMSNLKEELGDVLLQVLLHARIATELGEFTLDEVLDGITRKLITRHPHVFGTQASFDAAGFSAEERLMIENATDATAVLELWDRIKLVEKQRKLREREPANEEAAAPLATASTAAQTTASTAAQTAADAPAAALAADAPAAALPTGASSAALPLPSLLESIPRHEPALMQAQNISRKAVAQGFEWPTLEGVMAQLQEEFAEFEAAVPGSLEAELEFGDILFTLVNVARWHKLDAETALRRTCRKFRIRWQAMEAAATAQGIVLSQLKPEGWDELWQQAKQATRQ